MPGVTSGAEYPDYIAFRTSGDDGRLLTVVAALEPEDGAHFPWAHVVSRAGCGGDFKKVPCSYMQLEVDTAVARMMIDLIQRGRALSPDFIVKLRIDE